MSLLSLPPEILTIVGTFCGIQQLASLALANHSCYGIFNALLYKHNVLYDEPRKASILWAAKYGSLGTMKHAVAQGADINTTGAPNEAMVWEAAEEARNWLGLSKSRYAAPLHRAIVHGYEDVVRWLLESGARLDTPAFNLCQCRAPIELIKCSKKIWYPLHYAMYHSNSTPILSLLLDHGALYVTRNFPAIFGAIQRMRPSLVGNILGRDNFRPDYENEFGYTALHAVSLCKDAEIAYEIIHMLVDRGVPLNKQTSDGTVLEMMMENCKFECALVLLQRGAKVSNNRGHDIIDSLFHEAYELDIRMEEEKGDYDKAERMYEDRRKLLGVLIERGADVNRLTSRGMLPPSRPLFWALVVSKDIECLEMLLDAGARIDNVFRFDGRVEGILCPFFCYETGYASLRVPGEVTEYDFEEYGDCLRLLFQRGARIDSKDGDVSALEEACHNAFREGMPWELEFMADHATSQNVTVEHVETFMARWKEKDAYIYGLLSEIRENLLDEGRETGGSSRRSER
ncbi:hypothetical protein F53441_8971 [Fusarium austroafricanum]|uniref:F-box domain-containing protein n=1 Tax=Fusarium austroafricanum TaxID=2364996 RepID=A0A8H4KA25_9HYPO|nr:hypothetical protein F53441_8971 [Fusarium austroafricanum]